MSLRLLPLLCLAPSLFAQANNGRISGVVTDPSLAPIPKTTVVVRDPATNAEHRAVTDARGFYVVPELPVGVFSIIVDSPGFRKAEQTGVNQPDHGSVNADFKLEIGSVTDSVTVTEILGESVNVVTGELSNTIDSQQVQDLALN